MLNFALNRKLSKSFIRYYDIKDDVLIVYYGNFSREEFDNNNKNIDSLNKCLEEQVKKGPDYFNKCRKGLIKDERKFTGRLCFIYSSFITSLGLVSVPIVNFFNLDKGIYYNLFSLSGLLLLHPTFNLIKGVNLCKYQLFLNNKEKINNYLSYKYSDEFENEVYGKSVSHKKELCINDIRHLNIFSVTCLSLISNSYDRKLKLNKQRRLLFEKKEVPKTKLLYKRKFN